MDLKEMMLSQSPGKFAGFDALRLNDLMEPSVDQERSKSQTFENRDKMLNITHQISQVSEINGHTGSQVSYLNESSSNLQRFINIKNLFGTK